MLGADDKGDEPHIPTHAQVPALQEHTGQAQWPEDKKGTQTTTPASMHTLPCSPTNTPLREKPAETCFLSSFEVGWLVGF